MHASSVAAVAPRHGVSAGEDEVEEAGRALVAGLIARGEAVKPDEHGKLPPGATHELGEDDEGRTTARRRRFSAF